MPNYERLQPVTNYVNAPTDVALDHNECIYIAESVNNRVLIYSHSGQYLDTISGLVTPISVAVDSNFRIYVGNKGNGNVEVYDADYNYLFKLGAGDGEFSQPNDIEIDNTGKVYVADKEEHIVKIFNADGSFSTSFGISGNGDGEFHNPTSIAIDESAGEIIVLDHQLTKDMFNNDIEGARIQIFNMSGGFKRSFSKYGNEVGQMFRPQHITVDSNSWLYVTDSFHNIVLIYDSNGTYLGDIYDMDSPMRTPLGITIGESNRLYIASLSTGNVEVYGIDEYTQLGVSPLRLTFQGQEEGNAPSTQNITISNSGTGTLIWNADLSESWITLSEASGSVGASGTATINSGINLDGLTAGTYSGNINIRTSTGASEQVNVELEVLPAPELSVEPSQLTFTSINGSSPSSQELKITQTNAGTLNWTAVKQGDWISIDKNSGTGSDIINVSVDIAALPKGTYSGGITVTGESASSSPAVISVTLSVLEVTGTIHVTTNVEEATFLLNGPESFEGSGTNWSTGEAWTGNYSIIFNDVEGYSAPSSSTKVLEEGGEVTFTGVYMEEVTAQENQKKDIIAGAGPGKVNSGLVKVFDSEGNEKGIQFTAYNYGYGVNVSTGDINNDGYDEIITAPGPGPDNPAEIKVFDRRGNETSLHTTAFQYRYGASVASGDFDGDGFYEVVAGTGVGPDNPAYLKIFVYDQAEKVLKDSGINLKAYDTEYGVMVAVGDIDCNNVPEIITAPGFTDDSKGLIKIWSIDTSSGVGAWTASLLSEFPVTYSKHNTSVNIASGDVNGDGYYEIITGAGPHKKVRDEIAVFNGNGESLSTFNAYIASEYGAHVTGGDLDGNGAAEIVVGAGAGPRNRAIIKVFDANGLEQDSFKALKTRFGVNVAVGYLGLQ